jgi:ABC-2 type transport system permease protein
VAEDYAWTRDVELLFLEEPGNNATRQFYDFIQINLMAGQPSGVAHRAALLGDGVTVRSLDGQREVPAGGPSFAIIMPLLIGLAFLFLLLMSAGYLMQAVVEEKENRTMELLTTSLSPLQLMGGKVGGIVATGLTQLSAWIAITVAAVIVANRLGAGWFQDLSMDWGPILSTIAIAVPAYVVASSLMTAIGATTVSSQESQSIGAIFFILHLVPMWLAWMIIRTPNASLGVAMSFLPFTALLTVTLRNIFASVPLWQVILSASLQVLYAIGAVWLAGRAFRLGMLHYGRRLNLREILAGVKS